MAYQYPLQIKLNAAATFDNYLAAGNADIVTILRSAREPYLYLWSADTGGKTHLLQALCHDLPAGETIYLPLRELAQHPPTLLDGLEQFSMVCLDDIQTIAGDATWEISLFSLFNRLRELGGRLYISGNAPPQQVGVKLADLVSRLTWGPVFQLQPLSDNDKIRALQLHARQRGFQLPDEVAGYLLNHFPRGLHSLFTLLDKLDEASLQAQRRLTIPFVKQWL